jgi:hypothetical protein
VNVPFCGALATLAVFTTVKLGAELSVTGGALVQRAGSGATQPGSPVVTVAVFVTVAVLVLVAFNVTTVSAAVLPAIAVARVHVIVPGPVTVVGVHVQPAPLVSPVIVKPAGTVSVITGAALLATGPVLANVMP